MTVRYGRYEVVRKLGEGAMAAVHLGRDPVLMRFVAVKVLHPGVAAGKVALRRFHNEARTVAGIRSPHVVDVFDFGREGKEYFLVMEFVDGRSLQGMLRQLGGAGLSDVLTASLICQAAEGLDMAARHGVVHRDIKPENLMINTQGHLKVADFGIAHLQDESLTRTGAVLGSPLYMSPEQVRGAKPITSQSDMFSLGAVAYRCLAGAPPFESRNLKDLYRKIAAEPHVPLDRVLPGIDPVLARLVDILLRKDPAGRGEGPRWLRAQLRAWLRSRGIDDAPDFVAGRLRELSEQGIRTTWYSDRPGGQTEPIPRTVAATVPATLPPGWTSRQPDPWPNPFGPSRSLPDSRGRRHRPRTLRRIAVLAALPALAAIGALSYLVWPAPEESNPPARVALAAGNPVRPPGGSSLPSRTGSGRTGHPGAGPAAGDAPTLDGAVRAVRDTVPAVVATAGWEQAPEEPAESAVEAVGMTAEEAAGEVSEIPAYRPPESEAAKATLIIHSSPPFAEIYLDGRSLGVAPVTVPDLAVGTHRLSAKGRAGRPVDTLVGVRPGRSLVRIRMDEGRIALDAEAGGTD